MLTEKRPDFLGIGAHKAATNWLWQNLKRHPRIWMPPYKELHYFDRSLHYPSPSYLSSPAIATRLFGAQKHNVEFRKLFIHQLASSVRHGRWNELRWQIRHFAGQYDDRWYFSLFEDGAGKVKGEITPAYSILDSADVRSIREILPELKVIFMMRNPIYRAWSHVRFDWSTGRFDGINHVERIKAFIDSPLQSLRGDYIRTLDIWNTHFPPEQFFSGFYDDVIADPALLLEHVHGFLGLPARNFEDARIGDAIFTSKEKRIPDELLQYLAEKYLPSMKALSDRFGGHATAWLTEAEQILSS